MNSPILASGRKYEQVTVRADDAPGEATGGVQRSPGSRRIDRSLLRNQASLFSSLIEVLDQVMAGLINQQIARTLFISLSTVKLHLRAIAEKVGVRTRTAIVHAVNQELRLDR